MGNQLFARALSIRQPWAWLIVNGYKPVENRDWKTNYRGPFLVHADKKIDEDGMAWISGNFPEINLPDSFDVGGFVGISNLVDCVESLDDPWFFGQFGFCLRDSRPIDFVPAKGQLNFYKVEAGSINVVNVKGLRGSDRDEIIYVGREFAGWDMSPLANPYKFGKDKDPLGDYKRMLWKNMQSLSSPQSKELNRIAEMVWTGQDIKLGCWCHPAPCHAHVVEAALNWMGQKMWKGKN